MILLEVSTKDIGLLIMMIVALWLVPPIILLIVGSAQSEKRPTLGKILFIIAGIWFLIGGGMCGGVIPM